ncbi:hypothetical protein V498_05515 [Pseudogymnoascus sp. VKM F-4517 (FW-2822)]|nr:hypothetical protein V498_05515 [Pseudogymnoascus sp. VKM F-4517 (FW-2822)]
MSTPSTAIPVIQEVPALRSIRASIMQPQPQPQLSKVEQAVKLVLEMFAETFTITELVAAINVAKVKEAWLFSEIGKYGAT